MNNVVLKGKLGAGFNDDRYTLPTDGKPGDILVKTETGSAWQKQEPSASGGRVFVTGTIVNSNGINYIATDQTQEEIGELYNSGKEVVLKIAIGEEDAILALYNGTLFYSISTTSVGDTIDGIGLAVFGEPIIDGQRTLWIMGQFTIANQ